MFIRLDECEPRGLKNSTPRDRPTTHGCYRVLHRIGLQSFLSRPVREPRLTRKAVPFFSRDHYRGAIPAFQSCEQKRMRTLCSNSCVRPSSIVPRRTDDLTCPHELGISGPVPIQLPIPREEHVVAIMNEGNEHADAPVTGRSERASIPCCSSRWTFPRQASLLRGTHSLLLRRRNVSSQRLTFLIHRTMVMPMVI